MTFIKRLFLGLAGAIGISILFFFPFFLVFFSEPILPIARHWAIILRVFLIGVVCLTIWAIRIQKKALVTEILPRKIGGNGQRELWILCAAIGGLLACISMMSMNVFKWIPTVVCILVSGAFPLVYNLVSNHIVANIVAHKKGVTREHILSISEQNRVEQEIKDLFSALDRKYDEIEDARLAYISKSEHTLERIKAIEAKHGTKAVTPFLSAMTDEAKRFEAIIDLVMPFYGNDSES